MYKLAKFRTTFCPKRKRQDIISRPELPAQHVPSAPQAVVLNFGCDIIYHQDLAGLALVLHRTRAYQSIRERKVSSNLNLYLRVPSAPQAVASEFAAEPYTIGT